MRAGLPEIDSLAPRVAALVATEVGRDKANGTKAASTINRAKIMIATKGRIL
jgi:hypothetical protein